MDGRTCENLLNREKGVNRAAACRCKVGDPSGGTGALLELRAGVFVG